MSRRLKSILVPMLMAALLVGCGGSTRVLHYTPTSLVAFGDELSLITPAGTKHSVNLLKTGTTTVDCATYPVWPQYLASTYGMVFSECNPDAVAQPTAVMKAATGAKVADVVSAVEAYRAVTPFKPQTLVTLSAGLNDILAAYAAFDAGSLTREQSLSQVRIAAKQLTTLIDSITAGGAGARVLYLWPVNLRYSPYASAEVTRTGQEDRRLLLDELSTAFTTALTPGPDTGSSEVLLARVSIEQKISDAPGMNAAALSAIGLTNAIDAACTVSPLTACTTATLVEGAVATNGSGYLWASPQLPGPQYHGWLGQLARQRAWETLLPLD